MPTIAIIDDREDFRTTIHRRLELALQNSEWEIIDEKPLDGLDGYITWIFENKIAVVLLDEKLREADFSLTYNGHELVDFIRLRMPTLPIFILTAYPLDVDLQSSSKDVEAVIQKDEFSRTPDMYIPRFARAGQQFSEAFRKKLSTLSDISVKIIKGNATANDIENANAIKSELNIAFNAASMNDRRKFIEKYDSKIQLLEELNRKIEEFIENSAKK